MRGTKDSGVLGIGAASGRPSRYARSASKATKARSTPQLGQLRTSLGNGFEHCGQVTEPARESSLVVGIDEMF